MSEEMALNGGYSADGKKRQIDLANAVKFWPTPTCQDSQQAGSPNARHLTLHRATQLWPTPLATDGSHGGPNQKGGKGDLRLSSAVHQWPTPKANDAEKRGNFDVTNPRNGLPAAAKRFSTPQARDHRTGQPERYENPDRTKNLNDQIGGQLNPTWVEWLMGWPLGWTDLKPLATDRFRSAPPLPGASCQPATEAA